MIVRIYKTALVDPVLYTPVFVKKNTTKTQETSCHYTFFFIFPVHSVFVAHASKALVKKKKHNVNIERSDARLGKHEGMPSKWAWIIFNLVVYAAASLENDTTKAFIELTEFAYEDICSNTGEAEWAFINSPSNKTLSIWEEKLHFYATFKKAQRDEVVNSSKIGISDPLLQYKYDIAKKVGDALLESADLKTLVHFAGTAELLRLSKYCSGPLNNYTRTDLDHILSHSTDAQRQNSIWTAWHQELAPLATNFSTILSLVDKAAGANGAKDTTEYWDLLSGYNNGYNKIKYEWSKISNLHKKIFNFVKTNLSHKYEVAMNNTIPGYLLGSLQGIDWTTISVDATPYPDLMYNIKRNLWKRKLIGKSLYKTASAMGVKTLHKVPQADFWENSQFNQQCPSKIINFCEEGITRVSTCFEPTVSNFLSAHKNVGKILFNQMSLDAIPVLNAANRYSALEEGVSELFGILAASPAWLNYTHIMDNSTDTEQHLIVSLMITALNTLPRVAYYMSADAWRINAIETNITNSEDLVSSWWKYRQEYEGISSDGIEVPTFLNDDYITSNKPYLSKLTGTILAFQFYEYLMGSTEVRYDSIVEKPAKVDFIKMIQQGGAYDWMRTIDKFLNIEQISSDSLLSFFSPLEDFIDELEENFEYKTVTARESDLEELEKKVIKEMNASTTTTTTTTTTTSTTTPRSIVARKKIPNTAASDKKNDGRHDVNAVVNSNKDLQSKSAVHISEEKQENRNILQSEASTKVPFDESLNDSLDTEEDKKPKINTSKAVWAVGAVLLATIIICIIAIFGRQRCRKVPKNRRYV